MAKKDAELNYKIIKLGKTKVLLKSSLNVKKIIRKRQILNRNAMKGRDMVV